MHLLTCYFKVLLLLMWELGEHRRCSDSLGAGRFGFWSTVGARHCVFTTPAQSDPRNYPVSCTMGTGSFPGVKRPVPGVTSHPHLAPTLRITWAVPLPSICASYTQWNDLTYLLTYLLTPWSGVVLEKLTGFQQVKKFPAVYWTRRFITAFTSARHLSLSWAN
jgi:hypothetical protein